MEVYQEYPIRCKTCNEQIACFASQYLGLLAAGLSIEAALDELGITDYCSRNAMMNPTFVPFNMENREVIEGFKSVDAAEESDAQVERTSSPIFTHCMGIQTNLPPITTTATRLPPNAPVIVPLNVQPTRIQPNVPQLTKSQSMAQISARQSSMPILGTIAPAIRRTPLAPTPQTTFAIPLLETPPETMIVPGINLDINLEALGEGIEVRTAEEIAQAKFEVPLLVGVPTINENITVSQATIYVGAGKYVTVLNGRTHLAQ